MVGKSFLLAFSNVGKMEKAEKAETETQGHFYSTRT